MCVSILWKSSLFKCAETVSIKRTRPKSYLNCGCELWFLLLLLIKKKMEF